MPKSSAGFTVVAALAVALGLGGCAAASDPTSAPTSTAAESPLVLTTFTVLADMTRNVAGEHVRVESITKVGAEIHGYEPTPADLRHASDADLILDNGLGLEAWFAQFVEAAEAPHVVVSDAVTPLPITGTDAPNPHAWMSARNGQLYVDAIVDALTDLAPEHAAAFAANGEAYNAELEAVHVELVADLAMLPARQRALVTCEGAFSYLARDAGLTEHYIWPVNAEQQATPRQISAVIDLVRERDIPAVFCESTVSDRAMAQVVEATDAAFGGVLYVDSLSGPDGPVPTYLDLLRYDAELIAAGLAGARR